MEFHQIGRVWMTGLLVAAAAVADNPNAGEVQILGFQHQGTGCRPGSVASQLSPDGKALTLLFDDYVVDNSDSPSGIAQKNCQVQLNLAKPPTWEYSLFCLDYRGYANLESGAQGFHTSAYAFGSGQKIPLGGLNLSGPASQDYSHLVVLPLTQTAWSGCSQGGTANLGIDTQIRVSGKAVAKMVDLASEGGKYSATDFAARVQNIELVQPLPGSRCEKNRTFGALGTKAWVSRGCSGRFAVELAGAAKTRGLMTMDSLDGHVKHHYGIAWRRCTPGRWIQTEGRLCQQVCKNAGLRAAQDASGAACVSGEARPESATGQIPFTKGCWGPCTPMGNLATEAVGPFCYAKGQVRDADKTDLTVGCYCE